MRHKVLLSSYLVTVLATAMVGCSGGGSSALPPNPEKNCPQNQTLVADNCVDFSIPCAAGQTRDEQGICQEMPAIHCPEGTISNGNGICIQQPPANNNPSGSNTPPANTPPATPAPTCTPPQILVGGLCSTPSPPSGSGRGSGGSGHSSGPLTFIITNPSRFPFHAISNRAPDGCPPGQTKVDGTCISDMAFGGGLAAGVNTMPSVPSPDEEITIQDSGLRNAILDQLNLQDKKITRGQLESLTTLYYQGPHSDGVINDLSGLEYATNLEVLILGGQHIHDLSPIRNLHHLAHLMLPGNQIEDLSPLEGLTQLSTLELGHNYIHDLTPLTTLTNLDKLDLSMNCFDNVSPLAGLTQLYNLNLSRDEMFNFSCPLSFHITPLANLIQLTTLNLAYNNIENLAPLRGLTQLTDLNLSHNMIKDLGSLAGFTQLTRLDLSTNNPQPGSVGPIDYFDIRPLENLKHLIWLDLSNTNIGNLDALEVNQINGGLQSGSIVNLYGDNDTIFGPRPFFDSSFFNLSGCNLGCLDWTAATRNVGTMERLSHAGVLFYYDYPVRKSPLQMSLE